nr:MAG TPA: hypothetical protein [Caudoviricetes sp.]
MLSGKILQMIISLETFLTPSLWLSMTRMVLILILLQEKELSIIKGTLKLIRRESFIMKNSTVVMYMVEGF